jgi:hypothetical protein
VPDIDITTDSERAAVITIGDTDYPMLLTTRAVKEISKKYGGLSNLGEKLLNAENFELALSEICWLITLLINQPILIHNVQNPHNQKDLLTEDMVELLTTPYELAGYKTALMAAMVKGTKRNIISENEDDSKNTAGA